MDDNARLLHKGKVYILDESSGVKAFREIALVDNVAFTGVANPVDIQTPSGVSFFKSADITPQISFDLYHPGDNSILELLYRGIVTNTVYDGSTTVGNEKVQAEFRNANDGFVLPGYNGDKTAVTVNSVTSLDGQTTYDVTDDYTVAADPLTGMSILSHVSTGDIPLNTPVIVDYDYTPLASQVLKPDASGIQVDRFVLIEVLTECNDATKYRRYFLPRSVVTSQFEHRNIEVNDENANANIMPVTLEYQQPDGCSDEAEWYIIDTVNPS